MRKDGVGSTMRLLNLGCGFTRPQFPEWTNVDSLYSILPEGSPERAALDQEINYVNADIGKPLPFGDEWFDGVLLSHVIEHFSAPEGLALMQECRRVLCPGGVLLVSVPDASYFRKVYPEDRNENWVRLFGVSDPNNTTATFFEAALWFNEHKAILTEDALWSYFVRAGFTEPIAQTQLNYCSHPTLDAMACYLNRHEFSLFMAAIK